MAEAVWNGAKLASTIDYETVEGVVYFPPSSVTFGYLQPTGATSTCAWKGEATLFNVVANGEESKDAAWSYEEPRPEARNIKGYVAFGKRILVKKTFLSPSK